RLVADRHPYAHRTRLGRAREAHEYRIPLRDLVEPGTVAQGAGAPETRDPDIDEPRIRRRERLVGKAHGLHGTGADVFGHDVPSGRQFADKSKALRRAEVDRHAALVPVAAQVIGAHAAVVRAPTADHVTIRSGFDLDDVSTEVPEHHRAKWTGQRTGKIEHLDAAKRQVGRARDVRRQG